MLNIDEHLKIILIRNLSLFLPLLISVLILITREIKERQLVSAVLAFLWCFFSLTVLNPIAIYFNFWSFHFQGGSFMETPVDLLLGWAILWSIIPSLLSEKIRLYIWIIIFFLFDVVFMPFLFPVLQLGENWLIFDVFCILFAFVPSRLLFQLTFSKKKLYLRTSLQFIVFLMIFAFFLPMTILENSYFSVHQENRELQNNGVIAVFDKKQNISLENIRNRPTFIDMGSWSNIKWSFYLQILLIFSVFGFSAVQEFAVRGQGTPLPMDPPQKLVTTGPYAYIRNPMQVSFILIYLFLALILKNYWFAVVSIMACIYNVFATWSEEVEIDLHFKDNWKTYKKEVRHFFPLWKAWRKKSAEIYIDFNNCKACSNLNQFLRVLKPKDLVIKPAEAYRFGEISRLTYLDADGFKEVGICAFARAVEHANFFLAVFGFFLRLPVISDILQLFFDIFFPPHKVR